MLRIIVKYWKLNFLELIEYRFNFLSQIIGMFVSDIALFGAFYFIYRVVPGMGGISYHDLLTLQSVGLISFGYVHILGMGVFTIGDKVMNGTLDAELLLPKNLYWRLLVSKMNASAFGDLLFGFMLLAFLPIERALLIPFLSIISAFIYLGFVSLIQSLTFYIGRTQYTMEAAITFILTGSMYPPKIFEGTWFKIIYMTIIPVFYAYHIPLQLALKWNTELFLIMVIVAIFFMVIAQEFFYIGLRRYEGGNTIVTNV